MKTFDEAYDAITRAVRVGCQDEVVYVPTTQEKTRAANAKGLGFKDDTEKPRWDLLDLHVEEDVVRVLTHGAAKYADGNWQRVPNARKRYLSAALRHLAAWQGGEELDPDSQLPHLAHAQCCLHFLAWFDKHVDRRPEVVAREGGKELR